MKIRSVETIVFTGSALIFALILFAILYLTGGHFAYILDDTYIYLALAENLPFNYSVNAPGAEAGAASSSIIYPYLLLPLAQTPLALFAPLLVSLIGAVLVLLLLLELERKILPLPDASPLIRGMLILGFAVLINLFGLIFTGMEHTLHMASALAVLSGLLDLSEGRKPRWWFWLAVFAGPLIRYEALALSLPALVYAGNCGYIKRSLWTGTLMLGATIAFSFYLVWLGYGWLPSSVLTKSMPLATVSEGMSSLTTLKALFYNFLLNFKEPTAWMHAILLLVLVGLLPKCRQRGLLLVVLLAAMAHMLLGKFGWAGRYHAYVLAVMVLAIFYLARGRIKPSTLIELTILVGATGLYYTAITPVSANNVYRYHNTLNNFVVNHWQDDIAAFDIGYLAWRNPHTVVDLFGLASERIRRIVHKPDAGAVIPQLLADDQIDLIIAERKLEAYYRSPQWRLAGELQLDGQLWVTGLNPRFYLTNPARAEELRSKLEALRPQLPAGVTLKVY